MDTSLFDSYEQDLHILFTSVTAKLTDAANAQGGSSSPRLFLSLSHLTLSPQQHTILHLTERRKSALRRIQDELEEADEMMAQMEIEVQTADSRDKPTLTQKLADFKSALSRHNLQLKSLASSTDRDELLTTSSSPHVTLEMERSSSPSSAAAAQAQRTRMLSATDKLADGQRRLQESHSVALETERVGFGILGDLRGQRETLVNTRDNLYAADGTIDRASNTLKKMVFRMYQQKFITYAIIGVLIFLILWVIGSKFS